MPVETEPSTTSPAAARVIDGAAFAANLKREVAARVAELKQKGRAVHLTAILVGTPPGAELYAARQKASCDEVGVHYELRKFPADTDARRLKAAIGALNRDPSVTGIMLHLPLPAHLDATELQYQIDPVKDVEGVNPANIGYVVYGHTLIAPCTALAAVELIRSTGIELRGAEAVVVGASEIAGKPNLITGEHVRDGAIVIDVGINRVKQPDGTSKTVGDVDFEAVARKAGHITPVPGGVGPMTVAILLRNTLRSAELIFTRPRDL